MADRRIFGEEAGAEGVFGHGDGDGELGYRRWVFAAEALDHTFEVQLIFVVCAVELAGLSSQLDGLGHCRKGVRDSANLDLVSSPVLASPDPCSKCACDDIALKGRDGVWVEVGINVGRLGVGTPMAPVPRTFSGRLSSDAIGSRSPRRQRITEEIWLVRKGHSVQDTFCARGKVRLK